MGKIKSKMIRRTAKEFKKQGMEFSKDFEKTKKTLGNTMPSKKLRNKLAGFLAREAKQKN